MNISEKLREDANNLYNSGKYWGAISKSVAALTVNPSLFWPFYIMGTSYSKLKRPKESLACFGRFLEICPQDLGSKKAIAESYVKELEKELS